MQNPNNSHINNFDFLRFFAAALVFFSHSFVIYDVHFENSFTETLIAHFLGQLAVFIFFIISGFLVTNSYLKNSNLLHYVRNRFLRIFPGLAFATIFAIFIIGPIFTTLSLHDYFSDSETWIYLKTLTVFLIQFKLPGVFDTTPYTFSLNSSLWTLPLEAFMYVLVPIFSLLGLLARKRIIYVILGFYILAFIMLLDSAAQNSTILDIFSAYNFVNWGMFFFAGATIAIYFDKIPWKLNIFLGFLISLIVLIKTPAYPFVFPVALPYVIIYLAFGNLGSLKNFGKYGDFSYGIYIFAFPIQQSLTYLFWPELNFVVFMLMAFILTLMMAFVSWHFVEKPALKLKQSSWKIKDLMPKQDLST